MTGAHHVIMHGEALIMNNESELRETLEALRKDAKDPSLRIGDTVFCHGVYATVTEINRLAPGAHAESPIRDDWTAIQVVTDNGTRWHGVEPEAAQSGYTPCACRDCTDVAISGDVTKPALCLLCKDAGCEPATVLVADLVVGTECQRDDAYEG